MPTNSKEYQRNYQRDYRERMTQTRKVVSVSMPIDDFTEIERYAKGEGFSVSKLLREATLHQTRGTQMRSTAIEEELRELRFLISNIANNVNQMAHHSNRLRQVADENGVLAELQKLDSLIVEFTNSRLKQSP